jgi:histone deacetylase 1/2
MDNANSAEYLEKIKIQVIENMKRTTFAPSVQMTDVPRDPEGMDDEADAILDDLDEDGNKDTRYTSRRWDLHTDKEGELSESEDEDLNSRNGVRKQSRTGKRRNITDFQNPNAVPDDDEILAGIQSRQSEEAAGESHITRSDGAVANGGVDTIPSRSSSPKSTPDSAAADTTMEDADIEMGEEVAAGSQAAATTPPRQQEVTPPESPAPEAATTEAAETIVADEDATMGEAASEETAQDGGVKEREEENATGEKIEELAEESEQM